MFSSRLLVTTNMADVENEVAAPEGAEESQPEVTEGDGEQATTEATEAENEGQEETQAEEKPASPGLKETEETAEEAQGEASEENPATTEEEEALQPEEKPEDGGEAEQTEEGGEKIDGEETVAAESNVESSEAVENVDVQPDAADTAGETGAAEGTEADGDVDQEAEGGVAQEAEGGDSAETGAPAEPAEGAEAVEPSDVLKEDELDVQPGEGGEGGEEAPEGETTAEDGEAKAEEEEEEESEEKPEEEKGEEAIAEEGDREGSPVGEKLSREPTPDAIAAVEMEHGRLEATTPDKIDEEGEGEYVLREEDEERIEDEEEEDEEEEEPAFRREDLIDKYHEALSDREQLQQQNYALQHKLAEYFRKKKADERQDYDKNVTDQEQRYLKYMAQLEDLRRQDMMEKDNFRAQIEDAKERCQDKKEKVDFERKKFMEFKKQVALNAVNSRSGKPIPPKDIEQYLVNEVKKEQEVVNVRLENIKLKNKLKKKEQQLKSKEELAEGLHLIDFEQLKIENQTYNEKIEERNEELLKLRKKITSTVQVLTHLKEKLQFVQGENLEQGKTLKVVEASLAQSRDILSRTKQARDALRIDNQKLRQNCGLLGNEPLLRDFEERKDEGDDLRNKLEELRMKHAELTLHCNQVRRKIEQARQPVT